MGVETVGGRFRVTGLVGRRNMGGVHSAVDQLRLGVRNAVTTLGTGFLRHPDNSRLREHTDPKALRDALLRLVYRLLFVFVAEDRGALLDPGAGQRQREAYERHFSSARLREQARGHQGTAHGDQYEALRVVLEALGAESGRRELGLPGLGGLFSPTDADAPLDGLKLSDEALLAAVRHLTEVRDPAARRRRSVDYRHVGAEELGSAYESLLELEPQHSAADRSFELVEMAGNSRKTTGSYYTPSSLVECLLDTTLDPVMDDAVKRGEQHAAEAGHPDPADDIVSELLSLTVCDPACGSGHFLVASARRIAKRVASVRERDPEPTRDAVRHALHEVVARCIYGVDLNPMAVDLAKVSLWLEALEPGKPLGFLDAHVKRGNGLIGATPKLLAEGVPDDAFKPIEGDDRKYAAVLAKRNRSQRGSQDELAFDAEAVPGNDAYAAALTRITTARADRLEDVRAQRDAYRAYVKSTSYIRDLQAADAWCAAFVWPKHEGAPEAPTDLHVRALRGGRQSSVPDTTRAEILRLRDQYAFFHWHLEFPEVFAVPASGAGVEPETGWTGGFDTVVGNPPWERVKLQEQEFFAQRDPRIARAKNAAARKRLIADLRDDPDGACRYAEFESAKRRAEGESHFLRMSNRFPLTGRGDINTYAVFAETDRLLTGPRGRTGLIVPTGIATDATTQYFFKDLVTRRSLAAIYDFENRTGIFPAVDSRMKFCLLSLTGRSLPAPAARFGFFLQDPAELADPVRTFPLTPEEIALLSPNTGTCSVFRSRRDAEITLGMYRRIPVLVNQNAASTGNPWGVALTTMFHMSNDSGLFRPDAQNGETLGDLLADGWHLEGNALVRGENRLVPLYEGRMGHQFTHRFADAAGDRDIAPADLDDPHWLVQPQYWVSPEATNGRLARRTFTCTTALLGHRRVARNTDDRTAISALIPWGAASYGWIISAGPDARALSLLLAVYNSFAYDYAVRNALSQPSIPQGTSEQTPVPTPQQLAPHAAFITRRSLELTYTAHDMAPFARDLGDEGAPFRWDEDRRAVIRAELDALFLHLYGIDRDDAAYILDTFKVTRDNDTRTHGRYRTKDLILTEYDRMAAAGLTLENPLTEGDTGTCRSTLTPPPGHGPRHP